MGRRLKPIEYIIDPTRLRRDKSLGYTYFTDHSHPLANDQGKVYLHRHVASLQLGRWLRADEHVHHVDGVRSNNAPTNLVVADPSTHARIHHPEQKRFCVHCKKEIVTRAVKFCSTTCSGIAARRAARPSPAQIAIEIADVGYEAVGRRYGVSGNAIRRWVRPHSSTGQEQPVSTR